MNRRPLLMGAAAVLGLAAGVGWHWRKRAGSDGEALPDELWAARWPRAGGGEVRMSAYRGSKLVLNFWATWCPPCVRELPLLDRFQAEHAARGWQVIGLAVDRAEPVTAFLQRVPARFPHAIVEADGLRWSQRLGNTAGGLPFTLAMAGDGRIRQRKAGELTAEELASWANAV